MVVAWRQSPCTAASPIVGGIFLKLFCSAHFGFDPPWWLMALLVVVFTMGVNLIGVQVSVRTQLVIIIASLIPFVVLAIAVIADGGPSGNTWSVFNPSEIAEGGSVFNGLLFAILMFVGFELAAALGEETADPPRSIPVAILVTIGIVGVFYVLTQCIGTIGSGGADELPFDFAVLGELYVGRWLGILIELAVILDILAVGIGFAAATSRGLFTLGRDGLLPRQLQAVNSRDVPTVAALIVGAVALAVILIGLFVYGTEVTEGLPDAFTTFRPVVVFAGVIGLATAAAGVAAQFIDATAPVGDERQHVTI